MTTYYIRMARELWTVMGNSYREAHRSLERFVKHGEDDNRVLGRTKELTANAKPRGKR